MNAVEAMQALVDGKKVRRPGWREARYVQLEFGRQVLHTENGKCYVCDYRPVHPYTAWPGLRWVGEFELYSEPNPHAKGSFPWAFEEASRGKKVRRPQFDMWHGERILQNKHCAGNILATDWESKS
jgi:hypothetical protein